MSDDDSGEIFPQAQNELHAHLPDRLIEYSICSEKHTFRIAAQESLVELFHVRLHSKHDSILREFLTNSQFPSELASGRVLRYNSARQG